MHLERVDSESSLECGLRAPAPARRSSEARVGLHVKPTLSASHLSSALRLATAPSERQHGAQLVAEAGAALWQSYKQSSLLLSLASTLFCTDFLVNSVGMLSIIC